MRVEGPRFAFADAPNPVHVDWFPYLELPTELAAIELALVHGPILADVDYITDYSGVASGGGRRYRGLDDVLDAETLAHTRGGIVRLLDALLDPDETWFLFVHGALDDDLPSPAACFSARMDDGEGRSGTFSVVETWVGELDGYAPLFGACDAVAGLVAPIGSFATLLSRLPLAAALPTSMRYRFGSPFELVDANALAAVLGHGRVFFEEIDNGTRLRLITHAHARAALRERLAAITSGHRTATDPF
jgi:hypothetical protein